MKKIKSLLMNKKGNVGLNLVLTIFMLIVLYMMLGGMETNISVITVNEVKDILATAAPYAIRAGINEDAHKNETLLYKYDEEPIILKNDPNRYDVKGLFIKTVLDSLDTATFRERLVYDRDTLYSKLNSYTTIQTGSERWVNSWSKVEDESERKNVDFIILSTVLPIELKNIVTTSDINEIQEQFDQTNANGAIDEGKINVSFKLTENGIGAFIRFEMRVVLK